MLRTCLTIVLLFAGVTVANAAVTISIENTPSTYLPGGTIFADVRLQDATDLNLFSVDLNLFSTSGAAGADFMFNSALTSVPSSQYVFGDPILNPAGFLAVSGTNGGAASLSLSDLLAIGEEVDTVAGTNEFLARIAITTSVNAGDLSFSVETGTLELLNDNGDFIPPLQSPGDPLSLNLSEFVFSSPTITRAVPEPSSFAGISLVLLAGAGFRRRKRQRSALTPS